MNEKYFEIKRHHHYVWANYLSRWGNGGNDVYYSTQTKKIAFDSVRGIAVDEYFYKTTTLSDFDIQIIKVLSQKAEEPLQKIHMSYLNDYLKLQNAEEAYLKSGKKIDVIEKAFEATRCNILENLHSTYENLALPILNELANENYDVLNDTNTLIQFISFLSQQFTRTKAFRDRSIEGFARDSSDLQKVADAMANSWWILSYIFGLNLGTTLFRDRKQSVLALLVNDTDVPFITSDQPVINIHESVSRTEIIEPTYSDFYYPISPRIAFVFCDSQRFKPVRNFVDKAAVVEMNTKIAKHSLMYIVGNSKEAIRPFMKIIGSSSKRTKPE